MKKVSSYATRYLGVPLVLYFAFLVGLLIIFSGFAVAQSGKESGESKINCRLPEQGNFIEIRDDFEWASSNGGRLWPIMRLNKKKTSILDDESWTPSGVDVVVPIYKFFFFEKPDGMPEGKCAAIAAIDGLLVSPLGKVFRFEQATFDRQTLLLKFTTLRRDKLRYQGEFQFFAEPEQLRGGIFQDGTLSLKADAPGLGVVSLTFPIKSSRDE